MKDNEIKFFGKLPDSELVKEILNGNKNAVEYLLFVLCEPLFSYINRTIYNSTAEKHELISEFYIYISSDDWKTLKSFMGLSKLTTWISVVAVNFFKKKRLTVSVLDKKMTLNNQNASLLLLTDLSDMICDDFSKFELYDLINKMSNPRYKMLILLELQGLASEDIAVEMNISVDNVYTMRKRARRQLAVLLNEYKNVGKE